MIRNAPPPPAIFGYYVSYYIELVAITFRVIAQFASPMKLAPKYSMVVANPLPWRSRIIRCVRPTAGQPPTGIGSAWPTERVRQGKEGKFACSNGPEPIRPAAMCSVFETTVMIGRLSAPAKRPSRSISVFIASIRIRASSSAARSAALGRGPTGSFSAGG